MSNENCRRNSLSWLVLALLLPAVGTAKKGDTPVPLAYAPTTAVAEASAAPTAEIRGVGATLLITDERALADKTVIGSRSDDDDRRSELRATADVASFVEAALTKQARDWGFVVVDAAEAGVLLVGKITQFQVAETNQAVGATYSADVALEFELRDRAGAKQAAGTYLGDASRYGKKLSAQNANEVMSDALAEAFANALSDSAMRAAWGGSVAPTAGSGGSPITPEAALQAIEGLMAQGSVESALQDFLRKKTLTRGLGADDLAAWKAAGVPEAVVRMAMTLRVS